MKNEKEPLVSVLILTKNRLHALKKYLPSLLNQDYKNYEILILDNGSTDQTQQYIKNNKRFRFFNAQNHHMANNRNLLVNNAKGEFLLFIDDDCEVKKDWITTIIKNFKSNDNIGVIGGKIHNIGFDFFSQNKGRSKLGKNCSIIPVKDHKKAKFFGNAALYIKKDVLKKIGGYDPFYEIGSEEFDVQLRVRKYKYEVIYEPKAKINHYFTTPFYRINKFINNVYSHRIYMFLKFFRPNTLKKWSNFIKYEIVLFVNDLKSFFVQLKTKLHLKNSKKEPEIKKVPPKNPIKKYFEIFKGFILKFTIIISWIQIPYLYYKAKKRVEKEDKIFKNY